MKDVIFCLSLVSALFLAGPATAQTAYPEKPVKMYVGFPAGTNPDFIARELASALGKVWGQAVVVMPKPGAGGVLATAAVSQEAPDGLTLYLTSGSALVSAPFLYKKLGYDPLNAVTPIAMVAHNSLVLVTSGSSKFKNLKELVAAAKANPGRLTYVNYGVGSLSHVAMEKLQGVAGIQVLSVPYASTLAIPDLLTGTVDLLWSSLQVAGLIESGRLNAIAYSGLKRTPRLPNVPTVSEMGYPGFEALSWFAVVAPPGLSPAIVQKIQKDIEPIVKSATFERRMAELGNDVNFLTAGELNERIHSEYASNKELFGRLKIEKQ